MRKLIFVLLLSNFVFSQSKISIDSLNNISFAEKQEKASTLDDDYIKNAQNAIKINYKLGEAASYSNLSLVYYYQGKYEQDLKFSLKAISIYEKLKNLEKLAIEYAELGYRMKKRNMVKAVYYMLKAKRISEQNKLQKPLLIIYNNYGVLKEMQIQNDSALYFYKKGLVLKEKINDSLGIPYSLNNIALIYSITNQFSRAKPLYERALKIRILQKDQIGITENLTYFGDFYALQNQNKKAIDFYKMALEKSLKYNYVDLIQNSYLMLSQNYEQLNQKDLALLNFKKHIQFKDSLLNKETNSKIAELDVKFETEKKEKQIIAQQAEAKQKNFYLLGLGVLSLLIGLIGFLIYKQQRQKNQQQAQENQLKSAIAEIENQNKLQEQRLSISRDLHDNIGSQLTFIISSVDNVKYGFDITNQKLDNKLTNISSFAKDTILELRDTIWAMNSNEISFEDLEIRINNFIEKAKISQENISFSFAIDESLKTQKLSSVEGMNVYRTIQEAINNSLKYAKAEIVSVNIKKQDHQTKITISDNGVGFDLETIEKGNGLNNMKKRIEEIGGTFSLTSGNNGTKISFLI